MTAIGLEPRIRGLGGCQLIMTEGSSLWVTGKASMAVLSMTTTGTATGIGTLTEIATTIGAGGMTGAAGATIATGITTTTSTERLEPPWKAWAAFSFRLASTFSQYGSTG